MLKIVSCRTWGARAVETSGLPHKQAQGIIVHHTAGGDAANRRFWPDDAKFEFDAGSSWLRRNQIDDIHARGWLDTGYHFFVSRGGLLFEGRNGSLANAERGVVVYGSHCGVTRYNASWWGVALEGDFTDALPAPAQMEAAVRLCAQLSLWGSTQASAILGHRDVKATQCPGNAWYPRLATFADRVRAQKLALQGLGAK